MLLMLLLFLVALFLSSDMQYVDLSMAEPLNENQSFYCIEETDCYFVSNGKTYKLEYQGEQVWN
jgi:hypothetical protein